MELKWTEYKKLLAKRVFLLNYIDIILSAALYWMKQLFKIVSDFVAKGRSPSCKHFPILLDSKITLQTQKRSQNFIFQCVLHLERRSFSTRDGQKFPFGGHIGYGNSYLDSILCYSKVFRLYAILHDAAAAVRLHTGKGRGYCFMIGQGQNCCSLGHVTRLFFLS